jgi:hypothetical protein
MRTLISPIPQRTLRRYDFSFPTLDTFIRLETRGQRVVIRASRDTFSEARKRSFIRELAAEGFIDDCCRRFSGARNPSVGVRWVIDDSWLFPGHEARTETNLFMLRLLIGAGVLWASLLGIVFFAAFVAHR